MFFEAHELPKVAPILVAAAAADGRVDASEIEVVREVLRDLGDWEELPAPIVAALRSYDPGVFDLSEAIERLGVDTRHRQRALMALVGMVIAADGVYDPAEDAFLAELAAALGRSTQLDRFRDELQDAMAEMRGGEL